MFKRVILSICILVVYLPVQAQVKSLLILDLETELPVEKAFVEIFYKGKQRAYVTDNLGKVPLKDQERFDSVRVSHASYESVTVGKSSLLAAGLTIPLLRKDDLLPTFTFRGLPDSEDIERQSNKTVRITARDITFQNPQTSADVLGLTKQVFIQKSQMGGGSPMLRGFAANNVLLVVDGVRMNTAIFRDGNIHNIISLDPNIISKSEVIFGPGSVLYGSDALGGVFTFETKTPEIKPDRYYDGDVMLRGASANRENSWHVNLSYGLDKWAAMTSVSLNNYGDLIMGTNGPDELLRRIYNQNDGFGDSIVENPNPREQLYTGYSQFAFNQKIRFKPNSKNDFIAHFGYSTTSPIPRYDRLIQTRNGQLRFGEWQYAPQNWMQANLRYKRLIDSKVSDKMAITLAYQNMKEGRVTRNLYSSELVSRDENVHAYSLNIDFDKDLGKWDWLYGAEAVWNDVISTSFGEELEEDTSFTVPTRYPNGSSWYSAALYQKIMYTKGTWKFNAGLRYSMTGLSANFQNSFFSFPFERIELNNDALNGSLGLTKDISKAVQLTWNAATGFRSPNIDDVGKIFDSEPDKVTVPNPNLRPEFTYSSEIGLKLEKEAWGVQAFAYYTWIQDVIERADFTLNGQDSILFDGVISQVQALQNLESGQIYGLELQGYFEFNDNLEIRAFYNIVQGNNSAGNPIRHVSPNFGNAQLNYKFRRFKASFYCDFQGSLDFEEMSPSERGKTHIYVKDPNGNPYVMSWYTLNLKTTYVFSSALRLNIGLENILNQRYIAYSSGIASPGRNFILSIRSNF
jgi:hemoglobin/transferrin/lactoferrin receptor protein